MIPEPDLKVGEWQEIERKVGETVLELEFDEHGTPTGIRPKQTERVVKEKFIYAELIPRKTCAAGEHYFVFVNAGKRVNGRVEVQCRSCPIGRDFVVGAHNLKDGKLMERLTG